MACTILLLITMLPLATMLPVTALGTRGGEIKCTEHNEGLYGQRSVLDCSIQKTEQNMTILLWKKGGDKLVEYYRGRLTVRKGFGFAEPKWTEDNIIVSLIIENTTVAHEGEYTVMARGHDFDDEQKVNLRVTGKYSEPTVRSEPEQFKQKETATLSCTSEHGYPAGWLQWHDLDKDKPMDNKTTANVMRNDLYRLTSTITFIPESHNYACAVYNAAGEEEGRTKLALNKGETGFVVEAPQPTTEEPLKLSPNVVAPLVVIGSLIVGLLLVMVYFKRRAAQRHVPVNTEENIELSV